MSFICDRLIMKVAFEKFKQIADVIVSNRLADVLERSFPATCLDLINQMFKRLNAVPLELFNLETSPFKPFPTITPSVV